MHTETISQYQHTHVFGQDQIRSGERRTLFVIIMTGIMMVGEIAAGSFSDRWRLQQMASIWVRIWLGLESPSLHIYMPVNTP